MLDHCLAVKFHFHFFTPAVAIRQRKDQGSAHVPDPVIPDPVIEVLRLWFPLGAGLWPQSSFHHRHFEGCISSGIFSFGVSGLPLLLLRPVKSVHLMHASKFDIEKNT